MLSGSAWPPCTPSTRAEGIGESLQPGLSCSIRALTAPRAHQSTIDPSLHADRSTDHRGSTQHTAARQPQRCRAAVVSCSHSRPRPRPPYATRGSRRARSTRPKSRSTSRRASRRWPWADSGTRRGPSTRRPASRRPLWGTPVGNCSSQCTNQIIATRLSQHGRVFAQKGLSEELSGAPDSLVDLCTGSYRPIKE